MTDTAMCMIRRPDALRMMGAAPEIGAALPSRCPKSLDAAQEALLDGAALKTRARLCLILLRSGRPAAPEPGRRQPYRVPLSRPDIAGMLGVQPESLSRLLGQLRREGVLSVSGRCFEIPDIDRLRAEAMDPLPGAAAKTPRAGEI